MTNIRDDDNVGGDDDDNGSGGDNDNGSSSDDDNGGGDNDDNGGSHNNVSEWNDTKPSHQLEGRMERQSEFFGIRG